MRGPRFIGRKDRARKPNIGVDGKFRLRRQHSDHGETAIGEPERSSFQVRPALQHSFPKPVADHRDLIAFAQSLRGNEAAERGRHAEDAKEIS